MDKELLFKHRIEEADVDIEGLGTFRVRGLTRGEVFAMQEIKGTAYQERRILAVGLVDPKLSEKEIGIWQENSPAGEMEPLVDKIHELSGMGEKDSKSEVSDSGDESGVGV